MPSANAGVPLLAAALQKLSSSLHMAGLTPPGTWSELGTDLLLVLVGAARGESYVDARIGGLEGLDHIFDRALVDRGERQDVRGAAPAAAAARVPGVRTT